MSTTVIEYTEQQLAATGWAAMSLKVAKRLRPSLADNFGARSLHDFVELLVGRFPGVHLYQAQIETVGQVKVLARHPQFLAERMAWILGLDVSDVVEIDARPPVQVAERHEIKADDKLVRVRLVAAQVPPAHDCTLRRDILAARAELESRGIAAEPAAA